MRAQQYLARLLHVRQAAMGVTDPSASLTHMLLAITAAKLDDLPKAVSLLEDHLKLLDDSSLQGSEGEGPDRVPVHHSAHGHAAGVSLAPCTSVPHADAWCMPCISIP